MQTQVPETKGHVYCYSYSASSLECLNYHLAIDKCWEILGGPDTLTPPIPELRPSWPNRLCVVLSCHVLLCSDVCLWSQETYSLSHWPNTHPYVMLCALYSLFHFLKYTYSIRVFNHRNRTQIHTNYNSSFKKDFIDSKNPKILIQSAPLFRKQRYFR